MKHCLVEIGYFLHHRSSRAVSDVPLSLTALDISEMGAK